MKCEASECESTCTGGKCTLECSNSESKLCKQTCARGSCEVKCTAMNCESSCVGGHCAKFMCTADNCTQYCGYNCTNMRCHAKQCVQTCTKGYCDMYCETGAEMCTMSCPGGNCKLHCDGSWCKRDCFGGGCKRTGRGKEVVTKDDPPITKKPPKGDAPRVISVALSLLLPLMVYLLPVSLF